MSERSQKILFPASILVIWLIFAAKALTGRSVWISDMYVVETFTQYFPFKEFLKFSWQHGFFPLWTHNNECGFPFAAYPQTGTLYPLNLFFVLFDYVRGLNFFSVAHLLFASYCAYFTGRELNFSRFASWVLALTATVLGFPLITAGCIASLTHNCWTPAAFLFSLRLVRRPGPGNFLILLLALSLQMLSSEPEMMIYLELYIFFFLAFARRVPAKNLLPWVLAAGTPWLAGMVQVLPTADLIFHSYRRLVAHGPAPTFPAFLAAPFGLLFPGYFPYGEHLLASPVYVTFLAPIGLFFAWQAKATRRGFWLMLAFALMILLLLINPWPIRNLGAIGFVAPDARYKLFEPFQFWLLIVAASGIDQICRPPITERQVRQAAIAILIFAGFTLLAVCAVLLKGPFTPKTLSIFLAPSRMALLCATAPVAAAMLLFRQKNLLKNFLFAPLLGVLFLTDLAGTAWNFKPGQPTATFVEPPAGVKFISRLDPLARFRYASLASTYLSLLDPTLVRYLDLGGGPGYVYSLFRLGLYHTTPLLVASAEGGSNMGITTINAEKKPLMDMLGVRYVISDAPVFWGMDPCPVNSDYLGKPKNFVLGPAQKKSFELDVFPGDILSFKNSPDAHEIKIFRSGPSGQAEEIPGADGVFKIGFGDGTKTSSKITFENPSQTPVQVSEAYARSPVRPFHLIFDQEVRIYENSSAWPKYFLAQEKSDAPDPKAALPRTVAYSSQKIELRVNAVRPSKLVMMESFYPGWRAFVNGVEQKIGLANQGFQSVEVPAQESAVRLVYEPVDFEIGLWSSLATFFGFAVAGIFLLIRRCLIGPATG
jgi:hypothetical protein